jgi:signal transduction histidine kinase
LRAWRIGRPADDKPGGSFYADLVMRMAWPRRFTFKGAPVAFDRVLAVVLLVLGELQIWLGDPVPHEPRVMAVATLPMYVTVALRRPYPAASGFFAQTLVAVQFGVWGGVEVIPYSIAWGCAIYGLTVWTAPRVFRVAVVFVPISSLAGAAAAGHFENGVPFAVVVVAAMLLVRRVVGDRERRAQLAERERDVAAREAVVEERARIARELHDAIAHHVSVMVVQAGAERRTLEESNAGTSEVLGTIERTGRSALIEMRRLLGMLRDGADDPLHPQPGLADLPMLVDQLRDAGLAVQLEIEGERRELPMGIELSAYRIVQEALTNALKHAGDADATVHVRYCESALDLEISDDGGAGSASSLPGGHGLVGMRERVALCGGRFHASRNPAGGFTVQAQLPTR